MTQRRSDFKHREDLTGEHKFGDAGQLIIFLLFIAVWISDSFFFEYSTFLNAYLHPAIQITAGMVLLAVTGWMAINGIYIVFFQVRKNPQVIRKGVFRVIRHPIYTSEILLYLALLLFSVSLAAVAIWIIAIVFLHYLSRYEEKMLLARFGDDYRRYMEEVPMYFPRLLRHSQYH